MCSVCVYPLYRMWRERERGRVCVCVSTVQGVVWNTGPQVDMSVLVDTEQNLKQRQLAQERRDTQRQAVAEGGRAR